MQQVARVTSSQWSAYVVVVLCDEFFDNIGAPRNFGCICGSLKQVHELSNAWVANVDLEWNSAKKRFVN
jgi:hypothetical protein